MTYLDKMNFRIYIILCLHSVEKYKWKISIENRFDTVAHQEELFEISKWKMEMESTVEVVKY